MQPYTEAQARDSWREVLAYYEHCVSEEHWHGDEQLLELARWIAASQYAPFFRAWISMGSLCLSRRPVSEGDNWSNTLEVGVDDRGWFCLQIRGPSGKFLLKRRCEKSEVHRVLASALLRLHLSDPFD